MEGRGHLKRTGCRWEDDIKIDFQRMQCKDVQKILLTQYRVYPQVDMNMINCRGP